MKLNCIRNTLHCRFAVGSAADSAPAVAAEQVKITVAVDTAGSLVLTGGSESGPHLVRPNVTD